MTLNPKLETLNQGCWQAPPDSRVDSLKVGTKTFMRVLRLGLGVKGIGCRGYSSAIILELYVSFFW